jgi:hypothetical protein
MYMKTCFLLAIAVPLGAAMLPGSVAPDPTFTPTSLSNPTCTTAACDVIEGRLTTLPFLAIAGDVILLDPDGSVSDVVRFFNNVLDTGGGTGLGTLVLMYSRIDSGPDSSVGPDLGLPSPSTYSANAVRIAEAADGTATTYNGNGTLYSFYSDTPEPSSVICVSVGLLAIGAGVLRRRFDWADRKSRSKWLSAGSEARNASGLPRAAM